MRVRLVALVAASIVLCGSARAACPDSAKLYSGPPLGATYHEVRRWAPAGDACAKPTDDGCSFVDRLGIENVFTEGDAESRVLYMRRQTRARSGWLPYGITWADDRRSVLGKLRSRGLRPEVHSGTVNVIACAAWAPNNYWFALEFDRAGRLSQVVQAFHAY